MDDIRNLRDPANTFMKLKEARDMIPEMGGSSRNEVQKFLNASTYAMSEINPVDEKSLLKAILCTKLTGKAMYDFQTRDIRTFAQLKREIEMCYLAKRSTTHIQREFNITRQKPGENAQEYGLRVDKLAMELYQSIVKRREHIAEQRKAILDTIQQLALENFQLGLRDEIQIIVRSRNYMNLTAAILGATAEEKLKGSQSTKVYETITRKQEAIKNRIETKSNQKLEYHKCNRLGHLAHDCRSSQYTNRYPRAEKPANVNNIEKYCSYCKKASHKRDECWSLNGRPRKEQPRRTRQNNGKGRQINTAVIMKKNKQQKRSDDLSFTSSGDDEEEEKPRTKITRAVCEHQMTQVNTPHTNATLDLITLPMRETKKGKTSFLLDTSATLTLIKVGNLKGNTLMHEERLALTGVTGHKIHTLGKIRAMITLGDREIRHTMYVVRDDFPINYKGILGLDFLNKQQATTEKNKSVLATQLQTLLVRKPC
ncbi:hypothetical protein P5V15_014130 [Pogonomyrmex californicus]